MYFVKGSSLWIVLIVAALAKSADGFDRTPDSGISFYIRSLRAAILGPIEESDELSQGASRDLKKNKKKKGSKQKKNSNKKKNGNGNGKDEQFLEGCTPTELADYLLDKRFKDDVDDTISYLDEVMSELQEEYGDNRQRGLRQRFANELEEAIHLKKASPKHLAVYLMANRFDDDLDSAMDFVGYAMESIGGNPSTTTTTPVQTTSTSTTTTTPVQTTSTSTTTTTPVQTTSTSTTPVQTTSTPTTSTSVSQAFARCHCCHCGMFSPLVCLLACTPRSV